MASLIPWRKGRNGAGSLSRPSDFPLSQLRNEFDALFDRFFGGFPSLLSEEWTGQGFWGLDMDDTGKEIVVRAEAPGFEPGDFDIRVTGNTLTIQAERKEESGKEKGDSFFSQRRLQRSVTLPAGVDADKVDCKYKNGILELRLLRTEQAQPKRIQVKGS
jgi:HSP20 family protein